MSCPCCRLARCSSAPPAGGRSCRRGLRHDRLAWRDGHRERRHDGELAHHVAVRQLRFAPRHRHADVHRHARDACTARARETPASTPDDGATRDRESCSGSRQVTAARNRGAKTPAPEAPSSAACVRRSGRASTSAAAPSCRRRRRRHRHASPRSQSTSTSSDPRLVNRSLTSNDCPGTTGSMVGGGAKAATGPVGSASAGRLRHGAEVDAERRVDRVGELLFLDVQDPDGIGIGGELPRRVARRGQTAGQRRNRGRRTVHPERLDRGVHFALNRAEQRRRVRRRRLLQRREQTCDAGVDARRRRSSPSHRRRPAARDACSSRRRGPAADRCGRRSASAES